MANKKTRKSDLSKKVMKVIQKKQVKMRPKLYFILGSILLGLGLAGTILFSGFFVNLILFALKNHRPFVFLFLAPQFGLRPFLLTFPWVALALSLLGIWSGSKVLKKYDFSYKKNFWLLTLVLVIAILGLGFFISKTRVNPRLKELRHLRHFYHTPYSPPPLPERKHPPFLYK